MNINLIPCPIVREDNGLAISSRNRKLSQKGLEIAPKLHEILVMKNSISEKEKLLTEAGFKVDYITEYKGRLYAAAFLEEVRLIDNVDA